jgi:hypothetical protein
MAQKSKKQTRRTPAAARPAAETVVPGNSASMSGPASTISASSGRSFTTEFNPDYSQTIKDLKRIAILAGTFFVVLVILAFVLP